MPLHRAGAPGGFPDFWYLDPFRPKAPNQLFGTQSNHFCLTSLGYSTLDPSQYPVMFNNGAFSMASNSGHIHQGQAHSGLSECDSRPPVSGKSANNEYSNFQDLGNTHSGHVCHSPHHPSSPDYVSDYRALSTGDRCSVTGLAGEVDVYVSTVSPA